MVKEKINPRFIKTPLKQIPETWTVEQIGNVCSINVRNVDPTNNPQDTFQYIDISSIDNFQIKNILTFLGKDAPSRARRRVIKDDVIVSTVRPYLRAFTQIPANYSDYTCSTGFAVLTPNEKILSAYLFQYVISDFFVNALQRMMVGSSYPAVTKADVEIVQIPRPPIEEQYKITETLSNVDELLIMLEKIIKKKRNINQGVKQELLTGKRRLNGFVGEWGTHRLGDISILKARIGWHGLTVSEYLSDGKYFLVTGTDFSKGTIDWRNCHYVEEKRYSQDPNIQLKHGDVLVTKDGTIGKVAFIEKLTKPATLNSGVFLIRPKSNLYYSKFLYYLLFSEYFIDFLGRLSAGSTINHLYQKDFINFEFPLPPSYEEQVSIVQILSDLDNEIKTLEKKREKYLLIKKGMMQVLLTGRIRLQ